MDPIEALLTKRLDELESQVHLLENPKELHFPRLRSRLSFIKSLLAAETGGTTFSDRLSHIASRISALESIFSGAEEPPKTAAFRLRLLILRNNLQELESMAKEPFWYHHQHHSAAKIRSKIAFAKSLLTAADPQSEDLSSLRARIAAVEEAFGHLSADDASTQPSCSSTSCHTEEVREEEAVALSLKQKIEEIEKKESNGGDYDDAQRRKIGFLSSLLAAEREEKAEEEFDGFVKRFSSIRSEFAGRSRVLDDAIGSNVSSSSCSCTSSCFDGGEEKEKQAEEEENSVSGVNETGELLSKEVRELKSETAVSENGSEGIGGGLERRFGKLRAMGAMAGVFAVAAIGVVVGSFFSEKEMACLVPT